MLNDTSGKQVIYKKDGSWYHTSKAWYDKYGPTPEKDYKIRRCETIDDIRRWVEGARMYDGSWLSDYTIIDENGNSLGERWWENDNL